MELAPSELSVLTLFHLTGHRGKLKVFRVAFTDLWHFVRPYFYSLCLCLEATDKLQIDGSGGQRVKGSPQLRCFARQLQK